VLWRATPVRRDLYASRSVPPDKNSGDIAP